MSWGSLWGDSDYYYGGTPVYNDSGLSMPSSASSPTSVIPGPSTMSTGGFGFFPASVDWQKPIKRIGDDAMNIWNIISSNAGRFLDYMNPWSQNKSEKGLERVIDGIWHGDPDYSVKQEEQNLLADQNKYVDYVTQMQMAGLNPFASSAPNIADQKSDKENKAKMMQMLMMMMMMMGLGQGKK